MLFITVAAFAVDRLTKALLPGRGVLILGVVNLTFVRNTGASWGLFSDMPMLITVLTAAVTILLIAYLLVKRKRLPAFPRAMLFLLLGGAVGNLFDRIFYGYVVDFVELLFVRFPVFNLADVFVCAAFAGLAGWLLLGKGAARGG